MPRRGASRINRLARRVGRLAASLGIACAVSAATAQALIDPEFGAQRLSQLRDQAVASKAPRLNSAMPHFGSMTPAQRRAAVDAYWGSGASTEDKLRIFDTYWEYADRKYAAFQNLVVDWPALRARYRGEVAAGVSRGRFVAIMNHLSLALKDSHTQALDLLVNIFTVPEPGVPLMGQGAWQFDTSGACLTAQDDGSALVYSAMPHHPLGLQPGDRILGYDGRPWRELYEQLIAEEMPLWPLWWGSSASSFDHSFVMAAGLNWHLFDTMDIAKYSTGQVVHVSTNLMPGATFWGFCSEQMPVQGVPMPDWQDNKTVGYGVVQGSNIGYIYVWGWFGNSELDFANAVYDLTQVRKVEALVVDYRYNVGGFLRAPKLGTALLSKHPAPTLGNDERLKATNHFQMKTLFTPSYFDLDFTIIDGQRVRIKESYAGPVAVLVGPGALSAGDFGSELARSLPLARTFGKSTSMALGLPTQPALGTFIDLGPGWDGRVSESNSYEVGAPHDYLIHTEFPVGERVWLTPSDVASGKDTVVGAALAWINQHLGH